MNNINHLKLIFITIFFIFLSSVSKSEVKIAFVDIDKIIKESSLGKSMIQQLGKLDNEIKNILMKQKKSYLKKKKN